MFLFYLLVSFAGWLCAAGLVGWRAVIDPRRLIGWFFLVYLLTYVVRPISATVHRDSIIYDNLGIIGFDAVPIEMTVAVVLAIVSAAVGYRLGGARKIGRTGPPAEGHRPQVHRALTFAASCLILWGYVSLLVSPSSGAVENVADRGFGVMVGTTAWITESILFVSSGAVALYMLNRRLWLSLLITVPWFLVRVSTGWGRIILIGHLFALLAVFMVRERFRWTPRRVLQAASLATLIFFTLTVFFPSVKLFRVAGSKFIDLSLGDLTKVFTDNFRGENFAQTTGDIAGFETTVYFLETKQPPTWGSYYVYDYLIKPVPRVLWRSKPLPPDLAEKWFGIIEDYRFFGLAPGCVGGALQAWGWFGILPEFMLTGFVFRRLERKVVDARSSPLWIYTYAGFFGIMPQLGRDTLIHMIAERWLFVYGIPLLVLWFVSRSRIITGFFSSDDPRLGGAKKIPAA